MRLLAKRDGEEVRDFLVRDAVTRALAGQKTPTGNYNLERMVAAAIERGAKGGLCGTCMDITLQYVAAGSSHHALGGNRGRLIHTQPCDRASDPRSAP